MVTPRIAMVAYSDRDPFFIFVAVPNERGRYLRTDSSVAMVACPLCKAQIGEPCLSRGDPGSVSAKYGSTTHWVRRKSVYRGSRAADVLGAWNPEPVPDEWMESAS